MARRWTRWTSVWAVLLVAVCSAADIPFASLFDGKSLNGWTPEHTNRFSVRDGVLVSDGGTGWLRTAKAYRNFEFQAEYRALNKGADSGLFFRASAESSAKDPYWPLRGYQVQIADAESNLKIFGHGTAPPTSDRKTDALRLAMKATGEWQKVGLKVVGKHVEASLNGATITVSDGIELPEGYLGLQGENGKFEWRDLKIRELGSP